MKKADILFLIFTVYWMIMAYAAVSENISIEMLMLCITILYSSYYISNHEHDDFNNSGAV